MEVLWASNKIPVNSARWPWLIAVTTLYNAKDSKNSFKLNC